jgi:CRP-like cAMP-binding protein
MITETLRQIPLFAGLTEDQLEYVQQGNEIRLRPGEYVKRAGDPPDGFYIVIEGQVEWIACLRYFWSYYTKFTDLLYESLA